MISSISIEGYKSLRKLNHFPLRALNVLIGPNRAGKTNFLDFMEVLSKAGRQRLPEAINERGGIMEVISWGEKQRLAWEFIFDFSEENAPANHESIAYFAEITKKNFAFSINRETFIPAVPWPNKNYEQSQREVAIFSNPETLHDTLFQLGYQIENSNLAIAQLRDSLNFAIATKLRSEFANITVHRPFNTSPDAPIRNAQLLGVMDADLPPTRLSSNGDNLTNVLYYLQNQPEYREHYEEYLLTLQHAFPSFEDLVFPADLGQGKTILAWRDREFPKRAITANLLSDGTLRFMCLLAALYDPNPPSLLCIDEPENGLHPQLLRLLASVLKETSERMQIIISTHSPDLISFMDTADDVVITESEEGWSSLRRLSQRELEHWLKEYTLGELWKAGEIGGRT